MPHIDDGTLHALIDGALRAEAPERAAAVEAHLDACADCRARLERAAALRDEAGDVLAALDAGLADGIGGPEAEPVPDFGEVMARARAGRGQPVDGRTDGGAGPEDAPAGGQVSAPDPARLRRQLGWTRGLAWAATIVVALGTGYLVRDLAGPTGELPRAAARSEAPMEADAPDRGQPLPLAAGSTGATPAVMEDGVDEAARAATEPAGGEAVARRQQAEPAPSAPDATAAEAPRTEPAVAGTNEAEAVAVPEPEAAKATDAVVSPPEAGALAGEGGGRTGSLQIDTILVERRQPSIVAARSEFLQARNASASPEAASPSGAVLGRAPAGVSPVDATVLAPACYRLALGEWSPAAPDQTAPDFMPPERFMLMDSTAPGTPPGEADRPLLRPLIDVDVGHPGAFWAPLGPDSMKLVWSDGLTGVILELEVRGDTLVGRAITRSDGDVTPADAPTAPARAVRIQCRDVGG